MPSGLVSQSRGCTRGRDQGQICKGSITMRHSADSRSPGGTGFRRPEVGSALCSRRLASSSPRRQRSTPGIRRSDSGARGEKTCASCPAPPLWGRRPARRRQLHMLPPARGDAEHDARCMQQTTTCWLSVACHHGTRWPSVHLRAQCQIETWHVQ
jgi:hypothetical protein